MKLCTWTLLMAAILSGCGKGSKQAEDGPTCRQIVSYMMRFPEFGAFDERTAIEQCRQQKWNPAQRRCLYSAKDLEAMSKCVPAMKVQDTDKPRLPLPAWHPSVDQPLDGPGQVGPGSAAVPGATAPPGPAPGAATTAPPAPPR
jgi:hypothetical protein